MGGGIITGFQDKNTVLVCGDDGFEIPTLVKDVVVIDTDDYNIAKKVSKTPKPKPAAEERKATSVKQALAVADDEEEEEETDPADLELSYRPMAQERRGANELNLLLAFVPRKPKAISDTPFEAYLVNDCNYYVHYSMLSYADNACTLRHEGEIARNTKIFLEEFTHNDLHTWERITLQTLAFKRDKLFLPKPVMSINLRIDGTKFYKLHAFQPNMFFNAPALIYEVIKNDKAARDFFVDADELREAMQTPQTFMTGNEAAPLSSTNVGPPTTHASVRQPTSRWSSTSMPTNCSTPWWALRPRTSWIISSRCFTTPCAPNSNTRVAASCSFTAKATVCCATP